MAQLLDEFEAAGLLVDRAGPDASIERVAPADTCGPGDLVFADAPAYLEAIIQRKPAAVVATPELAARLPGLAVVTAKNVRLAQACILQRYFDRDLRDEGWPRIHPSAVIHKPRRSPSPPLSVPTPSRARARIGERCVVLAGAVIERDAVLGDDTVVHPNAVIGWRARSAAVHHQSRGGDRLRRVGFAQDAKRRNHRVPQLGRSSSRISSWSGAACCIDRAAFAGTRIGAGTDPRQSLHIAHNVKMERTHSHGDAVHRRLDDALASASSPAA